MILGTSNPCKNYLYENKTLYRTLRLLAVSLSLPFWSWPVYAANVSITGGTNGPDCNSGGYFTPSTVAIKTGDMVTISVPANDPYAGGLEVHGFVQGSFVVARGSSVTTNAISAAVSYYGTWPSTGCMKGSGTITVSAPVVTPPPATPKPPTTKPHSVTSPATKSTVTPKITAITPATSTHSVSPAAKVPASTSSPNPVAKRKRLPLPITRLYLQVHAVRLSKKLQRSEVVP